MERQDYRLRTFFLEDHKYDELKERARASGVKQPEDLIRTLIDKYLENEVSLDLKKIDCRMYVEVSIPYGSYNKIMDDHSEAFSMLKELDPVNIEDRVWYDSWSIYARIGKPFCLSEDLLDHIKLAQKWELSTTAKLREKHNNHGEAYTSIHLDYMFRGKDFRYSVIEYEGGVIPMAENRTDGDFEIMPDFSRFIIKYE